jgi:hypothetical protein
MGINYNNIVHSKTLENLPKILVWKYPATPDFRLASKQAEKMRLVISLLLVTVVATISCQPSKTGNFLVFKP